MTITTVMTRTMRPAALAAPATGVGLAVVFVAAWHHGLWLIVVALAAAAITVVASEHFAERTLAQRAATWALFAPGGLVDGSDVERTIAADLGCMAAGDLRILDTARGRLEQVHDPWLRGLAAERLRVARVLLEGDALPVVRLRLASWLVRRDVLCGLAASAALLVLAAMLTGQELILAPLTLTVAMVSSGGCEIRRRAAVVDAMCRETITPPVRGRVLMPEPAVVAALAGVTSGRSRVCSRARSLVATADGPQRTTALDRLALAAPTAAPRERSTHRRALIWAVACGVGIAAVELV